MKYGKLLISRGRLHQTTRADFSRDLSQSAWQSEDKVGSGGGNNYWHKKWNAQHDVSLHTKLGESPINQRLLARQTFNKHMRQAQILFERKATVLHSLTRTDETDKV